MPMLVKISNSNYKYALMGLILLSFLSCDYGFEFDGIVLNSATHKELSDVKVKLTTITKAKENTITNAKGIFKISKRFNCSFALRSCEDFKLTFEKVGFKTLLIDNVYLDSIYENGTENIVIKLVPKE